MSWQTQKGHYSLGGTDLATAAAVVGTGIVGAAVQTGKGRFDVKFTVTGFTDNSAYDVLNLRVQANTVAAPTVWSDIGDLSLGTATGLGAARTSLTDARISVINDADYQIRLYAYSIGSVIAATVTATLYPLGDRAAG